MSRVIRKNHSTASPQAIIIVDTEAREEINELHPTKTDLHLMFGKARYIRFRTDCEQTRECLTFTTAKEFWEWTLGRLHKKTTTWLFAHNAGFDLTLLEFWHLLSTGVFALTTRGNRCGTTLEKSHDARAKPALYVDGDPPTIIGAYTAWNAKLVCVDTMNYWPVALSELGNMIGLPKLSRPEPWNSDHVWHKYCDRDLDILERAVTSLISWVNANDYGMFRWTAPGQAMSAFRHRFMEHTIDIDRPHEIARLERQAYYGGRVEMLKYGEVSETIYELDVASMYPSVMLNNYFPCKLDSSYLDNGAAFNAADNPRLYTVAECLLDTDSTPYPIRCSDGTYYCSGRFWTTLCGQDLQDAFTAGHVRSVARWARYRMQRIFNAYVAHFWEQRQAYAASGDRLAEAFCKTLLNSLYGKFGQQSQRWIEADPPDDPWQWGQRTFRRADTGECEIYRSIAGMIQQQVQQDEHKSSFTAIAAWVTAYARQRMRQLVEIAGPRNVFYVVNDALYVNKRGVLNLQIAGEVQPGQLGKLRQKRYGDNAHFWAANHYRIGTQHVASGITVNAKRVSGQVYKDERFQRIKDITAQEPLPHVTVSTVYKILAGKTKRSQLDADGWSMPLNVKFDSECHRDAMRQLNNLPSFEELPYI